MTLTPAIREALQDFEKAAIEYGDRRTYGLRDDLSREREKLTALLSVVAAEEGRKYEALVKLVKEWQEAYKAEPITDDAGIRYGEARRALAQWEAL